MSEIVAYHVTGHAVTALRLGGKVPSGTIEPDNEDGSQRQGDIHVLWLRS